MNKKLIALAIATAVSAPAMAATSNVDVYGIMSLGVDSVTNNNAAAGDSSKRVGRVSDYVSRIGFKGTEDLGNGLAATWQIEQAVTADGGQTGAGNSASTLGSGGLRNTFVGLKSNDLGEVRLGRHDTPYKMATGSFDPFADTLGDYNNIVGAYSNTVSSTSAANTSGSYFDVRANNTVVYLTPDFSGFSAAASYAFGAETATSGSASTGNLYSLAAMYAAGPLYLTAAYEKQNFGSASTGTMVPAATSLFAANSSQKAWKLGASYNIMDFTLAAMYEKTDDDMNAGSNLLGHRTWFVSGKYQMGAVALKASYANAGSDDQTVNGVLGNDGAKAYTVGADYGFSKRTTVYALYTKISNDSGAAYNFVNNGASGIGAGDSVSGLSLGVKHSF